MSIQFARRWSPAPVPVIDGALSRRRRVAVRDRRRLSELLHQQLWCWGRDVVPGPAGPPVNLLVRYGLGRHPPADGGPGSNRYTSPPIGGESRVHLWAFGVCVEDGQGSLFLHRYHRGPRVPPPGWTAAAATGRPDDVPPFPRPRTPADRVLAARRLDRFLRWVAGYEAWVGRTLGDGYRDRTLARWEHPIAAGPDMPAAWLGLANAYATAAGVPVAPVGLSAVTAGPRPAAPLFRR